MQMVAKLMGTVYEAPIRKKTGMEIIKLPST